jgi:hypothetical protein
MAALAKKRSLPKDLYDTLKGLRAELTKTKLAAAGCILASKTHNFGSLADGAGESTDVTCPGAALGDFALASVGVDCQGMCMSAYVKSANTVTVRAQNETGGTVDLASTTVSVLVIPLRTASMLGLVAQATWNPGNLSDGVGESVDVTCSGAAPGDFAVFSLGVDIAGMTTSCDVTAANIVTPRLQNESGGILDLASSTVSVLVLKKADNPLFKTFDKDHTFGAVSDGAGASTTVACPTADLGDFVIPSLSTDVQDVLLSAHVKQGGLVTVRAQNESGLGPTLAASALSVLVIPKSLFGVLPADGYSVA